MLKTLLALLLTASIVTANASFDELDQISESTHNTSTVEKELESFEASLNNNNIDIDQVQPAAGFDELDKSFDEEFKE